MNLKRIVFLLIVIPMAVQTAEPSSEERGGFWKRLRTPAKERVPEESKRFSPVEGTLQIRAGYFQFTSQSAQKIYGSGAPDIELEGSIKMYPNLSVWSNLNYVWKTGHSTAFADAAHLDLGTLSIGLNLLIPFEWSSIYLGLGISGAYVHTKDHTSYLPTTTSKLGVGGVAKFGILIPCIRHFFLNPFFDYYYQPIRTRDSARYSSIDLGGFRAGIGIGYSFY